MARVVFVPTLPPEIVRIFVVENAAIKREKCIVLVTTRGVTTRGVTTKGVTSSPFAQEKVEANKS